MVASSKFPPILRFGGHFVWVHGWALWQISPRTRNTTDRGITDLCRAQFTSLMENSVNNSRNPVTCKYFIFIFFVTIAKNHHKPFPQGFYRVYISFFISLMFGETNGLRDTDYCLCPLPQFLRLILSYSSEKSHSPFSPYFKVLNASLRHDICWTICLYNKMSFITVAVYNNFLGSWIQSTDFWHKIWKWPSLEISP